MMKVHVVQDIDEAEVCDRVICVRHYPADTRNDIPGTRVETCCECGHAVKVAPSSPRTPPRLCKECMFAQLANGKTDPNTCEILVTQRTLDEAHGKVESKH
jgi:hypothetical protein